MKHVLIVAAYASVRAGLHALLAEKEGIAIVGEISGSAEFEETVRRTEPEVLVCDVQESETARIVEAVRNREIGLVMLGESVEEITLLAEAGLAGWAYLHREADGEEILSAVQAVAIGLVVLDRSWTASLTWPAPEAMADTPLNDVMPGETLTTREREVLQQMARGLPNKQIAVRLAISQHTVKFHVASILAKLGATSRTEAVTIGARRGYVLL